MTTATVTATKVQAAATIQVRANGGAFNTVASGAASPALGLNPGANALEVKVTAQDGATVHSYTLIVTRPAEDIEWASKPGNNSSRKPVVSADGRYAAFSSSASNLVPNDTNNADDILTDSCPAPRRTRTGISAYPRYFLNLLTPITLRVPWGFDAFACPFGLASFIQDFALATQARHTERPNRVQLHWYAVLGRFFCLRLLPTPSRGDAVTVSYTAIRLRRTGTFTC